MKWLQDDVVLITGGASGLGRALVDRCADEGARIVVLEFSPAKAAALRAERPDVVVVEGDVRSMSDNEAAVAAAVQNFGKLDVFIGNAGIVDRPGLLIDVPTEKLSGAFDEVMGVNVKGYILGARAAIPQLQKSKGSIVFTASSASFIPGGAGLLYTASKHAVVGVVRELAYQLAPDIRVNGVAPGPMQTDLRGSTVLGAAGNIYAPSQAAIADAVAAAFPLPHTDPKLYTGMFVALASRHNAATTTGEVINAADGIAIRGHMAVVGSRASL